MCAGPYLHSVDHMLGGEGLSLHVRASLLPGLRPAYWRDRWMDDWAVSVRCHLVSVMGFRLEHRWALCPLLIFPLFPSPDPCIVYFPRSLSSSSSSNPQSAAGSGGWLSPTRITQTWPTQLTKPGGSRCLSRVADQVGLGSSSHVQNHARSSGTREKQDLASPP